MKNFRSRPIETVKGDHEMIRLKHRFALSTLLAVAVFLGAGLLAVAPSAQAQAPEQRTFSSADDALEALVTGAQARDRAALAKLEAAVSAGPPGARVEEVRKLGGVAPDLLEVPFGIAH